MITRRHILCSGAAALMTAPLAPAAAAATRTVPSTGAEIPAIGLGTWITFNVGRDKVLLDQSVAVMRAFFEEGGGMIDSSPMYGSSQDTVGHGLAALGFPGSLYSAEKVWTSSVGDGPGQVAQSAREWRLDGFDLLQVHNLVAVDAHLEWLFERKAAGDIRHVGVTTSHGRRHDALEQVMQRYPLDFVQLTYNVLDRGVEPRLLPLAMDRGIGVIVNRPFRRGALIERTERAPVPGFSAELGAASWADLMLKFVLAHPAVTVVIPATTRTDHVRRNKAAARGVLPDGDLRERIARQVAAL